MTEYQIGDILRYDYPFHKQPLLVLIIKKLSGKDCLCLILYDSGSSDKYEVGKRYIFYTEHFQPLVVSNGNINEDIKKI